MFAVILALTLGIVVGLWGRGSKPFMRFASQISYLGLVAMLFCMGLNFGGNPIVMRDLPRLGWQGLLLAVGSSSGALLLCLPLAFLLRSRSGTAFDSVASADQSDLPFTDE